MKFSVINYIVEKRTRTALKYLDRFAFITCLIMANLAKKKNIIDYPLE